jgi:hypothetical protein
MVASQGENGVCAWVEKRKGHGSWLKITQFIAGRTAVSGDKIGGARLGQAWSKNLKC